MIDFVSFMSDKTNPIIESTEITVGAEEKIIDTLVEAEKVEVNPKVEEKFIYETPIIEEIKEPIIEYKNPLPESFQKSYDGYKLFIDKGELFECNIQIEGASIENSEVRLIIESDIWDLLFKGTINSAGKCSIPVKKLSLLPEGTRGKIKLEVIAEDTRFVPWEDRFIVKADKKVYVQVKEQKENKFFDKPSINVSGIVNRH